MQTGVQTLPLFTLEPSEQDGLTASKMPLGAEQSGKQAKVDGAKLPALQLKDELLVLAV